MVCNCSIWCQPSDAVGLSHTDFGSERAINPLPNIKPWSGFPISGSKNREPIRTSCSASFAVAEIPAPSPAPSHHLSPPPTSKSIFKFCRSRKTLLLIKSNILPAPNSSTQVSPETSVPKGRADGQTWSVSVPHRLCQQRWVCGSSQPSQSTRATQHAAASGARGWYRRSPCSFPVKGQFPTTGRKAAKDS